jgi:hypothetical protein
MNSGVEYLRFYAFQHPYVCKFVEEQTRSGVDSLLTPGNQRWYRDNTAHTDVNYAALSKPGEKSNLFDFAYAPNTDVVSHEFPSYNVDFDLSGSYSQYNWELFFHIPLFIATKLTQDQQFDKAMKWLHYIFNPTSSSPRPAPERYWFFRPFRDLGTPEAIKLMMQRLAEPGKYKDDIRTAIGEWRKHPFEPHRIARRRPGAYEKTVLMKYLDMLIGWGDQLFSRDTIESINEATQLYVLAAKLLGSRPEKVTGQPTPMPTTYYELRKTIDDFSNAMVQMENVSGPWTPSGGDSGKSTPLMNMGLYFCIPHNEKLLSYWDTVEDRLFKIRHCMNIEGVVRQLPLFEPPIDPALLVRARALGLDLASVLDDLSAPLPHYRFPFMLQKAREFCEELKQLGGLLLSALEKKDAERLAQIRANHEKALLKAVLEIKKRQVKEAEDTVASLDKAGQVAEERNAFYERIPKRIQQEKDYLDELGRAQDWEEASHWAEVGASAIAAADPTVTAGVIADVPPKAYTELTWGGIHFASAAQMIAQGLSAFGSKHAYAANVSNIKAGWIRRQDEWKLQARLAKIEKDQIQKQRDGADIRRQIAENELANHEKQIEQAAEIEDFLREKFTKQDLYTWMVTQVSSVYFQAYKLACDMAKRAERIYRYELGIGDSSFIQFGAWDNLRKGLLAGERLSLDLRRLEAAYLDKNRRTYELTRHISLAQLDPWALIALRETGECDVEIPEALFDLDYPGHYLRRIKSVSLTLPCVAGPYTSVSCTLTLHKHKTRRDTKAKGNDPTNDGLEWQFSPVQSIATSGARNDSGLFELNFHDERRLPFEGAGVVSSWHLQMPKPKQFAQFDYETITDVVFHISYTALEGGEKFHHDRLSGLKDRLNNVKLPENPWSSNGLLRALSFRHEFPNEWYRLQQGQPASITIGQDRLPYFASAGKLEKAFWVAKVGLSSVTLMVDEKSVEWKDTNADVKWGMSEPISLDKKIDLLLSGGQLEELWLIIQYTLSKA